MQTSPVVEPSKDAAENPPGISAVAAAKQWKAKLPRELRVASNARGLMLFGFSLAAYIVSFYWMCVAPRWTGIITGSMINALAIGAMFVAGHDAAHRTLVRSGWLNRVLGRIAMLPAWHPVRELGLRPQHAAPRVDRLQRQTPRLLPAQQSRLRRPAPLAAVPRTYVSCSARRRSLLRRRILRQVPSLADRRSQVALRLGGAVGSAVDPRVYGPASRRGNLAQR